MGHTTGRGTNSPWYAALIGNDGHAPSVVIQRKDSDDKPIATLSLRDAAVLGADLTDQFNRVVSYGIDRQELPVGPWVPTEVARRELLERIVAKQSPAARTELVGEGVDAFVEVTEPAGATFRMALDAAWHLAQQLAGHVRDATAAPVDDAPFTGPCPPWCKVGKAHFVIGRNFAEYHWEGRDLTDEIELSSHAAPSDDCQASVSVHQQAVEQTAPVVAVEAEWFDRPMEFTPDEADRMAAALWRAASRARQYAAGAALAVAVAGSLADGR